MADGNLIRLKVVAIRGELAVVQRKLIAASELVLHTLVSVRPPPVLHRLRPPGVVAVRTILRGRVCIPSKGGGRARQEEQDEHPCVVRGRCERAAADCIFQNKNLSSIFSAYPRRTSLRALLDIISKHRDPHGACAYLHGLLRERTAQATSTGKPHPSQRLTLLHPQRYKKKYTQSIHMQARTDTCQPPKLRVRGLRQRRDT